MVGACVLIWMPDSPVHARMLTKEQRIAALERVRDDQGGTENKKWKKDQIIEAVTDVRTWLIVLSTLLSEEIFLCYIRSFPLIVLQRVFLTAPSATVRS